MRKSRKHGGKRGGVTAFTNGSGKPLSNMALLELLRGMAPGFTTARFPLCRLWIGRTSARAIQSDVIDMALGAHDRRQGGGRLSQRRPLRQAHAAHAANGADFLQAPAAVGDNVTALRA